VRIKDKGISITAKFLFINTFILSLFLSILDISPDLKIAFVFKNFIQICSILSLVLIFLINLLDKDNQNKNNVRNYFKTIFSTSVIIIGLANLVIQLQKFPISRILSFSFPIIPIIILISTVLLFVIYKQHLKKKTPIRISSNIILILILILGAFLRLYRLGQNSIRDDELYVNSVAYNFINEGDFYKWDCIW
jgi:cytochrome bd-type quinol oxidase subunit 2